MGKGQGICRNKFSIKQKRRILASIFVDRNYLVQCSDYTLTTVCNTMVTSNSYPSIEDFEYLGESAKWQVDAGSRASSGFHWKWGSGPTRSSSTGPNGSKNGNYYVYTEASDFQNQVGIMSSPCFDFQDKESAKIEFNYHMYGQDIGKLELQASENGDADQDGSAWEPLWSEEGDQGNNWLMAEIGLDEFVGKVVRLRMLGHTLSGSKGDIALDNIIVSATNQVVTSVDDNGTNREDLIKISFNSNSKMLTLKGIEEVKEPLQLFVVSVSGQIVYNEWVTSLNIPWGEYRLDASQWSVGVYIMRMQSRDKKFSSTFLVR